VSQVLQQLLLWLPNLVVGLVVLVVLKARGQRVELALDEVAEAPAEPFNPGAAHPPRPRTEDQP
jgi:hypothetical protein